MEFYSNASPDGKVAHQSHTFLLRRGRNAEVDDAYNFQCTARRLSWSLEPSHASVLAVIRHQPTQGFLRLTNWAKTVMPVKFLNLLRNVRTARNK